MRKSVGVARRLLGVMRRGAMPRRFSPQVPGRGPGLGRLLPRFTVDDMIAAYRTGVIPNSDPYDDRFLTLDAPMRRAVIPIDGLRVPSNLARKVRNTHLEVRFDHDLPQLVDLCAETAPDRPTTWLGGPMRAFYRELHARGLAHSTEVWDGGTMVGGALGVAIGGAFFGDTMVTRVRDASKIALVHSMARLARGGFVLYDCQYMTDHLRQFGAEEIGRDEYEARLTTALGLPGDYAGGPAMSGIEALAVIAAARQGAAGDRAA